uniref:hypothetical protein n=1 Tax=Klebsiella oxytoca TaxID=571 RepID=UPI002342BD32|nr:hypothetical protein [Klebsiella oxytoca]
MFSHSSTSTTLIPLQHIKHRKSVLCTRRKIDSFSESNVQRREDGKVSGGYKPQCAGGNGHRSSALTGKK